jgi:hypothetical protein
MLTVGDRVCVCVTDVVTLAEGERDCVCVTDVVTLAEGERDCDCVTEVVVVRVLDTVPERDCDVVTVAVGDGESGDRVAVILPVVVAVGERLMDGDAVVEMEREPVGLTVLVIVGERLIDCVGDTVDVRVAVTVAEAADRVAVIEPVIVAVGESDTVTDTDAEAEADALLEEDGLPDADVEPEGEWVPVPLTEIETVAVGETDIETVAVADGVAGRQESGNAFSTGPIAPYADTS